MKTIIKLLMLAVSIIQIDVFAISNPKIINSYRPFSTPEKKQQLQTRSSLLPWTGLVLGTGIGAGLIDYFLASSFNFQGQRNTFDQARARLKRLNNAALALAKTNGDPAGGPFVAAANAINRRNLTLKQIPDVIQTIGKNIKNIGLAFTFIAPLVGGTKMDNKEALGLAGACAGITITGYALEKQTISHRYTNR